MLTDRQFMQIKRAIGYKYGFTTESVNLLDLRNVKKNIVVDKGRIEIEVDFEHQTGYRGTERFTFNPADMRTMPLMLKSI